jgi:hypothetical protein
VAEDGNETGLWFRCLSCHNVGNNDYTFKDGLGNLDPALHGAAFWFTPRLMRVEECVAAGSSGGFIYNSRFANTHFGVTGVTTLNAQFDQPTSRHGTQTSQNCEMPPVAHFKDNEAFATSMGVTVVRDEQNNHADPRSIIDGGKYWSCQAGIDITYSTHYTMINNHCLRGYIDGDIHASANVGISFFTNTSDQSIVNAVCEGFTQGLYLYHDPGNDPLNGRDVVKFTGISNTTNLGSFVAAIDRYYGYNINPNTPTLNATASTTETTGTKSDELGDVVWPSGYEDTFDHSRSDLVTAYGYYTEGATNWVFSDQWFSSRLDGALHKIIIPIDLSGVSLVGKTNNGTTDLTNNTGPTIADFTVDIVPNTNTVIQIATRATGNTPRFGGMSKPFKTQLIDNGDGTITAVPLVDENYTEKCFVWVDDKNANTTRVQMTINVGLMSGLRSLQFRM